MKSPFILGIFVYLLTWIITSCNVEINKSIRIADGKKINGSLNSVNGSIIIGSDCDIRGECRTVNGSIEIGNNSIVEDLQSVNGGISIMKNVKVYGSIQSINGPVLCRKGVDVEGSINTINGQVDLENVMIQRNITTYNGHLTLTDDTHLSGDIIVKKSEGFSGEDKPLKIEISDHSSVKGNIIVKDFKRNVEVYVDASSKITGEIKGAKLITY